MIGQNVLLKEMATSEIVPPLDAGGGALGGWSPTPRLYNHVTSGTRAPGKSPPPQPTPSQTLRSFQQILEDEKANRNILEVKLKKIVKQVEGEPVKPANLSLEQVGELIFDVIGVNPSDCAGVALTTHRYDSKEVKLKPKVDASKYLTTEPLVFKDHEVKVRKQTTASTRIVFKNIPFNIPDEEVLNLCNCYGTPIENKVHYDRPSPISRGIPGSTRFVNMKLFPGKKMMNYYWIEGPLDSDKAARITILHPGQQQQCFNCLKLDTNCPGAGNGKLCQQKGTPRGQISDYMKFLKEIHGYMSLKMKYHQLEYPGLNNADKYSFGHIVEEEEVGDEEGEEVEPEADIWKRRYDDMSAAFNRSKVEYSRLKSELDNFQQTKHNSINEEEHEISAEKENLKQMLLTANKQMDVINNEKNEMEKRYNSLHQELNTLKAKLSQQSDKEASPEIVNTHPKTDVDSPEIENVEVVEEIVCTPEKVGKRDPLNVDIPAEQITPQETEDPTPKESYVTVETAIDSEKTKNSNAKQTPEEAETKVEAVKKTAEKGIIENGKSAKENDEIIKVKINRKTYVHVNKSNFSLDKISDTVNVIDEKAFMQELNIKCNNKTDRATRINDMRTKALDKIKDELKDKQRERSNSVKRRPEDEIDEASYKPPKAQRNSSSSMNNASPIKSPSKNSMNLPPSPKKLGILGSIKSTLQGKEPKMDDFRPRPNTSLIPTPASTKQKNR